MAAFSSRRFNQDVSAAKRATKDGPVFITDRGRPAHVLMTIEEYRKLTAGKPSIIEMLAMPEGEDFDGDEFDRILEEIREASRNEVPRAADFD